MQEQNERKTSDERIAEALERIAKLLEMVLAKDKHGESGAIRVRVDGGEISTYEQN